MKKLLLIVTLLLVWAPGTALADWDARKSEAMSALEKATVTDDERVKIKAALETYFGGREQCFKGLIEIVVKEDASPQHATFVDRVGVCAVGAAQVLSRALNDIKEPSAAALEFVNVFSAAEAAFYDTLRATFAAEARDVIVVLRLNLDDMTEILDGKWKTILDEDKTLDERAKKLVEEIEADLEDVIKQAAKANTDAIEKIAEGVKQWGKAQTGPKPTTGDAEIDQAISLAKSVLGLAAEYWQNRWNTRAEQRVSAYGTLFTTERRVLVMFEDVREDVKEFLEKNDFPVAEASFAKAKSSLDGFVGSAKTSGLSADASELRDDLMALLTDHLKDAADVYAKFVGNHKEKFFGALGPDITEDLVEHEARDDWGDNIERYGLDAKVRTWQDLATNYFGVDLSPLSEEARERLKKGLRAVIDDLVEKLEKAGKSYRDVRDVIENQRQDVRNELK
jgi:hypothetical protein